MSDIKSFHPAGPFSGWERAIAGRYLRAKRKDGGVAIISIISFIGITVAVAVLIIVMSVMNGFRAELLGRILGFNGHAYVGGPLLDDPLRRQQAVSAILKVPGVTQVTPMVEAEALAQGPNNVLGAEVRGITASDLEATRIVSGGIKQGSLNGFGSGDYGGDLVILGDRLANQLGVQVGDPVTLVSPNGASTAFGTASAQKKTYTVGAVFSVGMSEYDSTFIYMPLPQAQLFFGRDQSVDVIQIMLSDPDHIAAIKPLIAQAAGQGATVLDWRDKNASFFTALAVERNTMGLILALIVVIAAANIISGLVMLVKNKGRDIAILRTMGASRGAILRIFCMTGATIGVLGTIAGLLIGVLFCAFIEPIQQAVQWATGTNVFNADVYFLAHIPAKIDWSEVTWVTALSLGMSFLATLPPAIRASRLDPVEALRYE